MLKSIRTALVLHVGKMLVWELRADQEGKQQLTAHPNPELDKLANDLKPEGPFAWVEQKKAES